MAKPVVDYFPLRGRGEPIRLCLAVKGIEFENKITDYQAMKSDGTAYPFGQVPRYYDGEVDLVQSNAIVRHLARKHNLYGTTEPEHCTVDVVMEAVEGLRQKYGDLIYKDQLAADKKQEYWKLHGDKDNMGTRNGGAHLAYFLKFLSPSGFVCPSGVSSADVCLFDIVDLHNRIFPEEMKATYPELLAHHTRFSEIPGVKAYLSSTQRMDKINGNSLG